MDASQEAREPKEVELRQLGAAVHLHVVLHLLSLRGTQDVRQGQGQAVLVRGGQRFEILHLVCLPGRRLQWLGLRNLRHMQKIRAYVAAVPHTCQGCFVPRPCSGEDGTRRSNRVLVSKRGR